MAPGRARARRDVVERAATSSAARPGQPSHCRRLVNVLFRAGGEHQAPGSSNRRPEIIPGPHNAALWPSPARRGHIPVRSRMEQASLARPGGNITGFTHLNTSLNPKRLEILKEAAPQATRLAALWHPGGLGERTERVMLTETEAAARALGLSLQLLEARGSQDLERVFAAVAKDRAAGLIVLPGPVFLTEHRRVVELAAKIRQPAIYFAREFAEAGGLMAYGVDMADILRGAASYVDKILKGTEPANLPVVQGSKFELVINLKAANAVGLTIPASLLARADEILQ